MSYSVKSNIEAVFGVANVAKWADLDNDEDEAKIAARVAAAIAVADEEMNDVLRTGPYAVPLTAVGGGALTSPSVVNMAAVLAGVQLYESRGVDDYDPEAGKYAHRLKFLKDEVTRKLREIMKGLRRVACERSEDAPTDVPKVVSVDLGDSDEEGIAISG